MSESAYAVMLLLARISPEVAGGVAAPTPKEVTCCPLPLKVAIVVLPERILVILIFCAESIFDDGLYFKSESVKMFKLPEVEETKVI